MNWFVGDAPTRTGIAGANFSMPWFDYQSGWYYVDVGPNTFLTVNAPEHIGATFHTDNYDPNNAGAIWLARQSTGGGGSGGGKK